MDVLKYVRGAFGGMLLATALVFSSGAAGEQFQVLFDTNNNPSTGCTVPTVDGPFHGVERILTTHFSAGLVTGVSLQSCINPATGAFGSPTQVSSGGWPVAIGGPNAENVVETYAPIPLLGVSGSPAGMKTATPWTP